MYERAAAPPMQTPRILYFSYPGSPVTMRDRELVPKVVSKHWCCPSHAFSGTKEPHGLGLVSDRDRQGSACISSMAGATAPYQSDAGIASAFESQFETGRIVLDTIRNIGQCIFPPVQLKNCYIEDCSSMS